MMSEKTEVLPIQVLAEVPAPNHQPPAEPPVNPLLLVHRLLRGRYIWAVLLALLLGGAGAVAGYKLYTPTYVSTGLIQIRPHVPHILYQTDLAGALPAFNAFVEEQASYLREQRVVDLAMQDPNWQKLGRGQSLEAVAKFTESLTVAVPRNGTMIYVSFEDHDRSAAMVAVRAVIEAYQTLHGHRDEESRVERMRILEERRTALTNQLKSLNDRIQAVAHEYGSTALERIYEFRLDELHKLEAELRSLQLAIAVAQGSAGEDESGQKTAEMSVEELAAVDPVLRRYVQERQERLRQMELLAFHYGQNHRRMEEMRHALGIAEKAIEQRVEKLRTAPDVAALVPDVSSLEQLRAREERVTFLYSKAREETLALGRQNLLIENLRGEAALVQQRLDETRTRIEHLQVESAGSGRISVASTGDRPLRPAKDRRQALSALGGIGGAGLGAGLVVLLGLVNQRLRNIADASGGVGPIHRMLGILPILPDDLSDPEQAATAAHCVHQIRAMLQIEKDTQDRRVFVITSPTAGDGKTTLALALGASFAAGYSKTLLIDCDFVGGGLTSRVDASVRRRIGRILRREGLLSEEELKEALKLTAGSLLDLTNSRRRLGDVLVERGYLTEQELGDALKTQKEDYVGILEALQGDALEECVAESGIPRLSILPLGAAGPQHVVQLSAQRLRRIFQEARSKFDMVLVDTGPILGSLEATVACGEADEVVVAISRGTSRALAEKAAQHLMLLGAKVAGFVFNRALGVDVARSGLSSTRSMRSLPGQEAAERTHLPRLGPIAAAVISHSAEDIK